MEPDQIIERLGSENPPTLAELSAAKDALEASKNELATTIKASKDSELSELVAMKRDYDALAAALTSVGEALTTAEAEIAAIVDGVEGGDVEAEPVAEEAAVEVADEIADEVVPVAASVRSALSRVRTNPRPVEPAPVVDDLSTVSTAYTLNGRDRDAITGAELGQAFADTARRWGGSKTAVLSMKTDLHPDRTLNGDASANERKMLDLFGANPVVPVTASGGCCSIPEPIYDQPLVGSLARPIRDALDVLQASRGAVQAYPPVCIPDSGADIWTCEQDEAVDPDDPDTWKSCAVVECEDSGPTLVEPIYKCLTIGTFQERFAPEQWEARLFQTDKLAARLAEARLFGWLRDSATSEHTGFDTGSTYLNFVRSLYRGAALIRQDQRLGDAQLVAFGPDWIFTAIAEDTMMRRVGSTEEIAVLRDRVQRDLANEGITFVGSQDVDDIEGFQYDGAFAAYPATASTVLLPAGVAKVLDGGEKNLGINITDMELNRQNAVGAFSEFWEGLLVRSCNIKSIDIPVDVCATVPCPA